MRKRLTAASAALMICAGLQAQTGVFDIHPASNPEGMMLTPELLFSRATAMKSLPQAAAESEAKEFAYSENGAVFCLGADGDYVTVAAPAQDGIVFGETVSRNEFGIDGGLFVSPDSSRLAFYRKDERAVTQFPLLDITTRTGSLRNIRYPMNGMASEIISLGIYDTKAGTTVWADVTDFTEERYLTNITWSPDSRYVYIQVVDRSQHHMRLNKYDASDGSFVKTVLSEDNDAWIEPQDPLYYIKGTSQFIYRTDNRDGYRSLYLCDDGGIIKRLTPVDADVAYVGNDGRYVYYYSAEVSPVERHLFRLDLKKKKAKPVNLTPDRGWHSVTMSADLQSFTDKFSSFNQPDIVLERAADGKVLDTLLVAPDPLAAFAQCEVDFGTVKSADGLYDNYYRLYKPLGFDPNKKYPLIVYVYGGPHSQMVTDSWLANIRKWEMLMAQKGYVVYVQDNRGTSNRGAAFEKAINRRCGQAEMADQMVGVRMLLEQPWIDPDRVGVHGWSYGGFMTISLMTNYPEIFKVGVAGGPVIDWKWYEIMYGERYMDNPETNPEGFALTSLMNKATSLQGKLLICQGAIDNTVVWQHSLSFTQKCIEEGIQLDYFPYPRTEHNVMGSWRPHLYKKITDYFTMHL